MTLKRLYSRPPPQMEDKNTHQDTPHPKTGVRLLRGSLMDNQKKGPKRQLFYEKISKLEIRMVTKKDGQTGVLKTKSVQEWFAEADKMYDSLYCDEEL